MPVVSSPYRRLKKESRVAPHHGVFRKQISLFEGVALITSGTIGAGVLGIPYAISSVGVGAGFVLIVFIGLLMMGVNLLVGDIAVRTGQNFQLPGLAGRYLGKPGKWLMTAMLYLSLFGVLLVYIIGEGETLAALFGGSPFAWSIRFFFVGLFLIFLGLRTIKVVELFLSLGVLAVVLAIVFWSAPHIEPLHWQYTDLSKFFVPYGVLLFAFHGTTAIPEAWSIMERREAQFKKAIVIAGSIVMAVYLLFSFAVVGVTGMVTTEIATIGLGAALGQVVFVLGNVFAALAMGTGFLMAGIGMRDSLRWDFHIPGFFATLLVCLVPLGLFLFGFRGFIRTIGVVGGWFMSVEILLILLMWLKSRKKLSTAAP